MKALIATLLLVPPAYCGAQATASFPRPAPSGLEARLGTEKDDFAAWVEQANIVPRDPGAPSWVHDAAGSTAWAAGDSAWGTLRGRSPGKGSNQLVGYSRQLEPTRERARAEAERSAAAQLGALAVWQARGGKKGAGRNVPLDVLLPRLEERLRTRIADHVIARYDQQAEIHREPVYRAAVLVAVKPKELERHLDAVASGYERESFTARRRSLWLAGSVVGAAIAVFLGYSLLNAATRGHFAGTLRVLSVLAFAALLYFLTRA